MTKIKDLLFKDKKRTMITSCSLILVVVILLSAILIPEISNMNKKFKTEEEMISYMSGVYISDFNYGPEYFIFDAENKFYTNFSKNDFYQYFLGCLETTKDLETLKNITFEECVNKMKQQGVNDRSVEFQYENAKIIYQWGENNHEIEIQKDTIILYPFSNEEAYNLHKIADSPLDCDEMKENFEKAKEEGVSVVDFLPTAEELDQRLINTGLNTAFSMNFLKGIYNNDKSMTLTNTQYTSFDKMFEVIYQYMKDIPGFSEDAKGEIRTAMENGEVRDALKGTAICAEFTLYGVKFITTYKPLSYPKNVQYTGYSSIVIIMEPSSISLSN